MRSKSFELISAIFVLIIAASVFLSACKPAIKSESSQETESVKAVSEPLKFKIRSGTLELYADEHPCRLKFSEREDVTELVLPETAVSASAIYVRPESSKGTKGPDAVIECALRNGTYGCVTFLENTTPHFL